MKVCGLRQARLVLNAVLHPRMVSHVMRKAGGTHLHSERGSSSSFPLHPFSPVSAPGLPCYWRCTHLHGCWQLGNWIQSHAVQGRGKGQQAGNKKRNQIPPGARVNLCREYGPVQSCSGAILGMQIDHVSCFLITSCEHALACGLCGTTPSLSREMDSCV